MNTKKSYDGWCLCGPDGKLYPETFDLTKDGVWTCAITMLNELLEWGGRYWYRWDAARRAAGKAGYKIVKIKMVKVKP